MLKFFFRFPRFHVYSVKPHNFLLNILRCFRLFHLDDEKKKACATSLYPLYEEKQLTIQFVVGLCWMVYVCMLFVRMTTCRIRHTHRQNWSFSFHFSSVHSESTQVPHYEQNKVPL